MFYRNDKLQWFNFSQSSVFMKTCFRLQLFIGLVYPYSINLQTTKESFSKPGVEVQAFNPGTQEAEAGKSLYVWEKPGLQSEFEDRQPELQNETLL